MFSQNNDNSHKYLFLLSHNVVNIFFLAKRIAIRIALRPISESKAMKWNSYISALWLLGYSCDLHLLAGELIFILLFNSLLKIEMYKKECSYAPSDAMRKKWRKNLSSQIVLNFYYKLIHFLWGSRIQRKTLVKSTICLKSFWNELRYKYNKLSIRNKTKNKRNGTIFNSTTEQLEKETGAFFFVWTFWNSVCVCL